MGMYLRKKNRLNRKSSFIKIFLLFLLLVSIFVILFINYYSKKAYPIIYEYAEAEVKKFVVLIINNAINEEVGNEIDDDIFNIKYSDNNEVLFIDYDYQKTSQILRKVTKLVEKRIYDIENGNLTDDSIFKNYNSSLLKKGTIVEIPFGVITSSPFFNNMGPKIPVKISLIGDVLTGVNTEVVNYGINNALLKLMVDVSVDVKIIMPISSDDLSIKCSLPISIRVIQGKIPNYYINGSVNSNLGYNG